MKSKDYILGFVPIEEAAARLSVSPHQVRELVKRREVEAVKVSARSTLVDAASLARYEFARPSRGRPWSQPMAMGALCLLAGLDAPWLKSHHLRRLRSSLSELSAEELAERCRKRAQRLQMQIAPGYLERAIELLRISGFQAAETYSFNLVGSAKDIEGYAAIGTLDRLADECFAIRSLAGNVVVHIVDDTLLSKASIMPESVVALDLAEALDPRCRLVGLDRLEGMLDEWRSRNDR